MLLLSGGWLLPTVVGIVFMVVASVAQDQQSNGPIISPNVTEIILQMGQNFTLTCKGKNKLEFMQQEPAEDNLGSFCINKTDSVSMDGNQFETKLDLYNIDQFAIGYYACFYSSFNGSLLLNNITEELKNTDQISFIYIYVNGTESLYAPMREFIIPRSEYTVVIECRPTTPDVEVTLMSDNADDYEYERYNPKVGFVLDMNSDTELGSQQIISYTCGFQRQHTQDTKIIFVEPHQIQPPPQPNIKQRKIPFMDGDTFSINCTVIYNDIPVNLSWETPASVPLETKSELNNKYSVQKGKLYYTALTITNASILHQGTYTCVSTNFNPISKKISATTKYYAKPILDLKLFPKRAGNMVEYNVKEVNQITFSVAVSAYPPVENYKLLKDGRVIQSDNLKYTINTEISGDLTLYINHISVRDSGNYTYVAYNMCRKDKIYTKCLEKSLSLEIRVKDAPIVHFNSKSNKKYVTKNTQTSLECVAEGYPLPIVEWRFTDETGLVNGSIKNSWSKPESLYKLSSIVDVNATMSGNITCSASNSEGIREANQTLLVYDIPDGFGIKNRELSWFPEETDVELTCLASKYKFKNLTWTTNVEDLNVEVQYPNETLSLVAIIKIEKIRLDQNGTVFTCHGFNLDNSTQTESISLTVEALQTLVIEEPMDSEQFFYPRETSVHLTCIAKGVPPPEIMWYKDDVQMSNNESLQVYITTEAIGHSRINSSMRLSDMKSVKGKYVCVAKSHGIKQTKVYNVLPFQAMSKTYTQILIPIIVIIFLLILLVLYLILKVKKEKRFRKELAAAGLLYFEDGVPTSLNPELGIDEQAELLPYNNKYEFPPEKLILGKQLGAGAFGVVYKAEARGIVNAEETTIVAVKMVKKTADNMFIKALTSELKIMLYLGKHVNIVNLLGACTKNVGKRELSVIVEYCKFGNIHNYMQKHREVFIDQLTDNSEKNLGKINRGFSSSSASTGIHSEYCDSNITQETDHTFLNTANTGRSARKDNAIHQEESVKVSEGYVQPEWRSNYETDYFEGRVPRPLFSRDLLCWSFQIARGMEYLASRKILHGDLAARNVLLADDNVVKICDFGLARNIYNNDEYQKKENSPLPVKWLAIECMTDRIFSTQSDVWSFGIVLWEIFSLAKTPYPNIAPSGLLQWLAQGHRLEKPPYADDRLYDVMRQCWQEKPTMRPSFSQLQEILGSFLEDNVRNHYVDLNTVCMASNVKMDGQEDYLDMVCAPDYKNMVTPSPHHYVNQNERFFPPTPTKIDQEGYLQMSPAVSDSVFSPRSQANKFDFDAQKYNSRASEASSCGSELTPMLTLNNLPARSGSESEHEGNVSPHIHLCPPIEEETDEVFEKQNNAKNLQNNCIVQNTGITNLMYIKLDDINNEKKPNDITNHYINIPNGLVT